jgi:hypothetical protein
MWIIDVGFARMFDLERIKTILSALVGAAGQGLRSESPRQLLQR